MAKLTQRVLMVFLMVVGAAFAFLLDKGYLQNGAEIIGLAVGVAATILGALASSRSESSPEPAPRDPSQTHLEARLAQVRSAISRHRGAERWSRFSSGSLTFAQYVIGGVLATSFIQESLSNEAIGAMGVVVVAASVAHQRYRPDARFRAARYRRFRLEKLLREAEDEIFAVSQGREGAPSEYKIAKALSRGLDEIDMAELEEAESNAAEESE